MTELRNIVSDAEIERIHCGNFGNVSKRKVVDSAIEQTFIGYSIGSTAQYIIIKHGLARLKRNPMLPLTLTPKGIKYMKDMLKKRMINNLQICGQVVKEKE